MFSRLSAFLAQPLLAVLLFGVFVVLNILDGHSTYLVMKPCFFYRERNPVARFIFKKLGIPRGIIIFKALLLAMLAPAIGFYAAYETLTLSIVLLVADLLFLYVVIHNYRVWRRLQNY